MGESNTRRWRWLGTWHFWRKRGSETLQTIEPWVKIAVLGAPAAHYLGLSAGWSVVVGLSIVLGSEVTMIAIGWFDHRQGIILSQQQWNNEQDEVKMRTLHVLEALLAEVQALRGTQESAQSLREDPNHTAASIEDIVTAAVASRMQSL